MNFYGQGKFLLAVLEGPGAVVFNVRREFAFPYFPRSIIQESHANWHTASVTSGVKPLVSSNREPLRIVIDELWLDKTDTNESIRPDIVSLQVMQVENPKTGRPPLLLVCWGETMEVVVLENLRIEENFFTPEGDPLRARVSLVLLEHQEQNERVDVVIRGDVDGG